jgi:hypothetical protein
VSRGEYARVERAYFNAMQRLFTVRSEARFRQLHRLAGCLADRLAGHDALSLFGGSR